MAINGDNPTVVEETRRATALAEARALAMPAESPEVTTRRAREFYRFLEEPNRTEPDDRGSMTGSLSEPTT